jgi:hypothetical protein
MPNRYAQDVADWCQRSLDDARKHGRLETRPFVQNVELIILALRAYDGPNPKPPIQAEDEDEIVDGVNVTAAHRVLSFGAD